MNVILSILQSEVYEQVKMATEYTGAKRSPDGSAYRQIMATDKDIDTALPRFWSEAESEATQLLKPFVTSIEHTDVVSSETVPAYKATLSMPSNFDTTIAPSMNVSLQTFFVESITAAWFRYCNKEEVESYAANAATALEDVRAKLYYRKKPTRPTHNA